MPELKLNDYIKGFEDCLQYEKPYCQTRCPFHVDVNDFIEKIKQGNFNSAFKIYRNAVGFPRIVSHICSQPCKSVCPMKDNGGAINLRTLERSVAESASRTEPTRYNLPEKSGKIAIIGSGLAGLGALLRMSAKKYEVHVFEKTDRIGGLLNQDPEADLFFEDIRTQLQHEKYEVHLNTEISTWESINRMGFQAVFVATGRGGEDFGISESCKAVGNDLVNSREVENMNTKEIAAMCERNASHYVNREGVPWFAGGALIGDEGVDSLAGGLHMGMVLEAYLKTKRLEYKPNILNTKIIIDCDKIIQSPAIKTDTGSYNKEKMICEAKRCIQCKCDFCRTYEDLTAYYEKWPLRIKDEIVATTLEGTSEVKATPAKRLMSTSNLTGITKKVCPMNIDLDGLILAGRQKMHRLEKSPWVFHDFWLRDMNFSNGENAAVSLKSPLASHNRYVFFPGCQLGATLPHLVEKAYEYILSIDESTGLMLMCCGAPALWSGDVDKHEKSLKRLKSEINEIGAHTLITACPTCTAQFKEFLPEFSIVSIYEYMEKAGYKYSGKADNLENSKRRNQMTVREKYSVFDPCSTREDSIIRDSVRKLLCQSGIVNIELPLQSKLPSCCSFGGQPAIANPDYADHVTNKRLEESDLPYITYCINCRDTFIKAGKDAVHLLELLLGEESVKIVPTVSKRRDNRVFLKKNILKKYLKEEMMDTGKKYEFKLIIPENIQEEMDKERILEEEVYDTVDYMIRTNRKVVDPETKIHSGYKQIGYMTFWVSYKDSDKDNVYEIVDVYNHRMEIESEAVWNGVKTDTDM